MSVFPLQNVVYLRVTEIFKDSLIDELCSVSIAIPKLSIPLNIEMRGALIRSDDKLLRVWRDFYCTLARNAQHVVCNCA